MCVYVWGDTCVCVYSTQHLERICALPTIKLKVELSHVNVGKFSVELETLYKIQKFCKSHSESLNKLCYHNN